MKMISTKNKKTNGSLVWTTIQEKEEDVVDGATSNIRGGPDRR